MLASTRTCWRYLPLLACVGFLGCLSFSLEFAGRRDSPPSGVLEQSDCIKLAAGQKRPVYYPVPYHNVPHLELSSTWSSDLKNSVILSQERDHFVLCAQNSSIDITWTAKGLPITVALPAPPVVVVPGTPPPAPPVPMTP